MMQSSLSDVCGSPGRPFRRDAQTPAPCYARAEARGSRSASSSRAVRASDGRPGAIARKGQDAYGGRSRGDDIALTREVPTPRTRAGQSVGCVHAPREMTPLTAGRSPSSQSAVPCHAMPCNAGTTRALRIVGSGAAVALRRGSRFAGSGTSFIFAERSALPPGRRLDESGSGARGLDVNVRLLLDRRSPLDLATGSRQRARAPATLP
ncbi:hypothetical protein OH77DRAFT_1094960 [Trametes cingulata]|nr:hypothetical protein OH77DRAFT_1094960 [Trametes cingulata]